MKYWEKAEKKHAKASGERRVPRSGAGITQKGDTFSTDRFTEVKSSQRANDRGPYIVVEAAWFAKTLAEANRRGQEACVVLVLGPGLARFVYVFSPDLTRVEKLGTIVSSTTYYLTDLQSLEGLQIGDHLWLREKSPARISSDRFSPS